MAWWPLRPDKFNKSIRAAEPYLSSYLAKADWRQSWRQKFSDFSLKINHDAADILTE